MAIDVGTDCFDGARDNSAAYTVISYDNAANATGTITQVKMQESNIAELTAIELASFTDGGSGSFTTTDYDQTSDPSISQSTCGTLVAGTDFTTFNITSDDYIGTKFNTGELEVHFSSGNQSYYYIGDGIPADPITFTQYTGYHQVSIYGTGTESAGNLTIDVSDSLDAKQTLD